MPSRLQSSEDSIYKGIENKHKLRSTCHLKRQNTVTEVVAKAPLYKKPDALVFGVDGYWRGYKNAQQNS